ncbi:MAG: hypothetical protein JWQ35_1589, partial [Bacteriovoracaceae bacterium]|nr:hypothetical protein [Bacteriovoracaceae bacterium]
WQDLLKAFFVNPFMDGLEEEIAVFRQKNPQFDFRLMTK